MSAAIRPALPSPRHFQVPNQAVAGQKQLQPHPGPAAPSLPSFPLLLSANRLKSPSQTTDDDTQDESSPSATQVPPRTRGRDGQRKRRPVVPVFIAKGPPHLRRFSPRANAASSAESPLIVPRAIAKRQKYLLDEEELEKLKSRRGKSSVPETSSAEPSPVQLPATAPAPPPRPVNIMRCLYSSSLTAKVPAQPPFDPSDQMFTPVPFDPSFPFGSEAANLEYSILSAILGNPSPPQTTTSPAPSAPSYSSWPSDDPMDFTASRNSNDFGPSFPDQQIAVQPSDTTLSTSPTASFLTYPYPQPPEQEIASISAAISTGTASSAAAESGQRGILSPSHSSASSFGHVVPEHQSGGGSQLQNINDRVTMPYDYTEGYHFLMKHLPSRFEKNDILRIVRALAIFRPSLIALQMPLSFDDEVFVEKCFQRTLLELDKLISFSGTPTVVWRRTGEICLVAPEFCMLTEWSLDELVGRKKYIYELFENQSVVEYWENFASHAFENTTQSVYSHCVLLKPTGAPVPSTFCFSIRRDLFDLPSVVIGQWLPLL
ncbi:transcription activator of gluconeogenesis ERT1 [Mycena leptocephala]|nr:transcription activator of gluconeogenesis ERT1 [Mycena leptocephala]